MPTGDEKDWQIHQPEYGMLGIAIGGKSFLERYGKGRQATVLGWPDDRKLGEIKHPRPRKRNTRPKLNPSDAFSLQPGESFNLSVPVNGGVANLTLPYTKSCHTEA